LATVEHSHYNSLVIEIPVVNREWKTFGESAINAGEKLEVSSRSLPQVADVIGQAFQKVSADFRLLLFVELIAS